jgi:mRNA-degrading endonuclease RelE of RelBE toxin-antitoxin system
MLSLCNKVNKLMSCRYRILAQVGDDTVDVEFVMIGKRAENIIGMRA